MKKVFINTKYVLLSFFVPVLLFIVAGTFSDLFPLGEKSILAYDGAAQYPGLASYFIDVLKGTSSLLYSFKGGLGYNYYSTAAYYLFSPLNIFLIFFKAENIHYFYSFLVLIKIGLCGLSMFTFLKYKCGNNLNSFILSVSYSLMAYNVTYFSNYMWLDGVIMLPLVILGIEKLFDRKSKTYFLVTLSLSIIFNFYIGYMISAFSLVYFIFRYVTEHNKNKLVIKDFLISVLLIGLITSFVTIPVFLDLLTGKGTTFKNAKYFKLNLDFLKVIYRFLAGAYLTDDIAYGLPNVYCSVLVLFLNVIFYLNKKIPLKKRIACLVVTLFFFLSFSFNLLDYAWQMFQEPIWYPNRYSFIFSFFLITIAADSFSNIKNMKFSIRKIVVVYLSLILLIVFSAIYSQAFKSVTQTVLIVGSIIIFLLYNFAKKKNKIILVLFLIEVFCNTAFTLKNLSFTYFMKDLKKMNSSIVNDIQTVNQNKDDNDFYRMELHLQFSHNNGAFYGFNGVTFFSSLRNSQLIDFFDNYLGVYTDKVCRIDYVPNNVFLNAFFGIKYLSSTVEVYYDKIYEGYLSFYESDDYLPLSFVVSNEIYDTVLTKKDYLNNYEKIIYDVTGKVNFEPVKYKTYNYSLVSKNGMELFQLQKTGRSEIKYYDDHGEKGFLFFKDVDSFKKYGGKFYKNGVEIPAEQISSIYYVEEGEGWKITYGGKTAGEMPYEIKKQDLDIYFLKEEDLKNYVAKARERKMDILEYKKDDYIKGEVISGENEVLFTTIPYDKGWSVLIDGESVEIDKVYDTFIGVDLPSGKHTIEFTYCPPGLKESFPISLIGIVSSGIYIFRGQKKIFS